MPKIIKPTNKVTVFDPETGTMQEAISTEQMMERMNNPNPDVKTKNKKVNKKTK